MNCKFNTDYASYDSLIDYVLRFGKQFNDNNNDINLLLNFKDIDTIVEDDALVTDAVDSNIDPYSSYIFCKGWYDVETCEGEPFRWSKPVSYINLSGLKGKILVFRIATNNPALIEHDIYIFFTDYTTGDKLGSISLSNEVNVKPVSINIDTDNLVIMIMCDSVWVPSVLSDESTDNRDLSFSIECAEFI